MCKGQYAQWRITSMEMLTLEDQHAILKHRAPITRHHIPEKQRPKTMLINSTTPCMNNVCFTKLKCSRNYQMLVTHPNIILGYKWFYKMLQWVSCHSYIHELQNGKCGLHKWKVEALSRKTIKDVTLQYGIKLGVYFITTCSEQGTSETYVSNNNMMMY
jgi:hypothetical protein